MGLTAEISRATAGLLILAGAIVVVAIWVMVAVFVGRAAERKNRSFMSFFLIALFISPTLGAIIVAALPPDPSWLVKKGRLRSCPSCAEGIRLSALVCPHCQSNLSQSAGRGVHAR
jgi:hypothetical protein